MGIEWEETVETKRRVALVVDLKPSEPFDAPDEVRAATIDDLRRACEAVGWYQFHDWEAVHAICDEHGVSHETMNLNAQMMRPALARERVRELVVKLSEKEERYYQDALTAEAERNACLDALSEHVSPDATADAPRMVRPSSVLAGIRSLQGRLRDARSDLREHDAALEAAVERRSEEADASTEQARAILNAVPGEDIVSAARRTMASLARSVEKGEALRYDLSTIVDEAFGMQPVMTHEELLSFLESGLRERTRDLAAARARAEKAESRISKAEATSGVSLESVASAYAFACKKLGINPDSDNLGRGVVHATRERDDLRARLETAERLHSEAEAQVECRNALRYRIASLEADLTAARARIAELEAPMPEATITEIVDTFLSAERAHYKKNRFDHDAADRAGALAVAERVRRERPPCLIARAVAGKADVDLVESGGAKGAWYVRVATPTSDKGREVPAAEVPAELARMLTEVGA